MKKIIALIFVLIFVSCHAFAGEIYHYDKKSKAFVGSSIARLDPREGTDLIPAFATNLMPPVCEYGVSPIFENNGWAKKINLVGQHYYEPNGTKVDIKEYGVDIPLWSLTEDPPSKYHDSHDGIAWIENAFLKEQDVILQEIVDLKADLKTALVWQFRMIEALYEVGVSKGVWSGSDISDTELKQKYSDWKTKLVRLRELGE